MANWRKALQQLDGAFSDHTLRSYGSGFGLFAAWCRERRQPPLPAASATVVDYIDWCSVRLKPGTVHQRLCAIKKIHRLCCQPDPTRDQSVDLAMRRVRRSQPSRPRQAMGLTTLLCDGMLGTCRDDLIGMRDRVLLGVGFDTLCRQSELVSIRIEDLTETSDGRYSVLVRRAKTDPSGAGRTALLSTRTSQFVDAWLDAIGATKGPLLRPVHRTRALPTHLYSGTVWWVEADSAIGQT